MKTTEIRTAYARIRTIDHTISDDVLDFMKDAAIEKIESSEFASLKEEKWISVSEKMPDFDVSVLVFCRIYGVFIAQHKYIGDFQGEKYGNWYDGKNLGVLPPLFWMPLPSPPKEEK